MSVAWQRWTNENGQVFDDTGGPINRPLTNTLTATIDAVKASTESETTQIHYNIISK